MGFDFELEGERSVVHPIFGDDARSLSIDGTPIRAELRPGREPGEFQLQLGDASETIFIASDGDAHYVHWRGRTLRVGVIDALKRAQLEAAPDGGGEDLRAPMPGVVIDVVVEAGEAVEPGQLLMTIESMKLQTAIVAPHAARVAEVCLGPAARFDQGAVLIRLEPLTEPSQEDRRTDP